MLKAAPCFFDQEAMLAAANAAAMNAAAANIAAAAAVNAQTAMAEVGKCYCLKMSRERVDILKSKD